MIGILFVILFVVVFVMFGIVFVILFVILFVVNALQTLTKKTKNKEITILRFILCK